MRSSARTSRRVKPGLVPISEWELPSDPKLATMEDGLPGDRSNREFGGQLLLDSLFGRLLEVQTRNAKAYFLASVLLSRHSDIATDRPALEFQDRADRWGEAPGEREVF